jgi:fused signal recognition particle receptor
LIKGSSVLDDDFYDELEAILIGGDVGARTVSSLVSNLKITVKKKGLKDPVDVRQYLKDELSKIVLTNHAPIDFSSHKPYVIVVVGVNGVGKTTTIGKLASRFREDGKKVVVAAADTFRAAAIDQLEVWADRAGAEIVKKVEGSDPAAVAYEAVVRAKAEEADIVISTPLADFTPR